MITSPKQCYHASGRTQTPALLTATNSQKYRQSRLFDLEQPDVEDEQEAEEDAVSKTPGDSEQQASAESEPGDDQAQSQSDDNAPNTDVVADSEAASADSTAPGNDDGATDANEPIRRRRQNGQRRTSLR